LESAVKQITNNTIYYQVYILLRTSIVTTSTGENVMLLRISQQWFIEPQKCSKLLNFATYNTGNV